MLLRQVLVKKRQNINYVDKTSTADKLRTFWEYLKFVFNFEMTLAC